MNIRFAEEKDVNRIIELLTQVCSLHHKGRPDLFKDGAQKYTRGELIDIIHDDKKPIFVASDEDNFILGYAFCILQQHSDNNFLTDIKTLYIDDLCVDENIRGQHIGRTLYNAILSFARDNGCYNITLNVWSCNKNAMKFYESCGLKLQKSGLETIL